MAEIEYPDNLKVQGQLAFPLYSNKNIEQIVEWRKKKGKPAAQFPDKIGATLFLDKENFEKARTYLLEVFFPFQQVLEANGKKHLDGVYHEDLIAQIKDGVWIDPTDKKKARPNLPLRGLTKKDEENLGEDHEYVGKIKFFGPYQQDLGTKALVKGADGKTKVRSIRDLIEDEVIPEERSDTSRLWWGSGWDWRASLRFGGFESPFVGISGYSAPAIYLLPHKGLPVIGGNAADAEMVEDGDDQDWA